MLIHWPWDENFASLLATDDFSVKVAELLRAHRRGHHLVAIERRIVTDLLNLDLSSADKSILQRLAQEFTQTGSMHRISPIYLRINNAIGSSPQRVGSAILAPFELIISSRILDTPALLVENVDSDGWVLGIAIRAVAERSGRGVVSFEPYHGGGDDLPKVLSHLIRTGRAVYAVVDSDRDSPLENEITKLRSIRRILRAANWIAAEGAALPCREAENLLPRTLVMQVQSALGKDLNAVLQNIDTSESGAGVISSDRYWSFVDLKEGLNKDKISNMSADSREWVLSKLAIAGIVHDQCTFEGYGNSVASQIERQGVLASQLRRHFHENHWREMFVGFFDPICWFFLSTTRSVV